VLPSSVPLPAQPPAHRALSLHEAPALAASSSLEALPGARPSPGGLASEGGRQARQSALRSLLSGDCRPTPSPSPRLGRGTPPRGRARAWPCRGPAGARCKGPPWISSRKSPEAPGRGDIRMPGFVQKSRGCREALLRPPRLRRLPRPQGPPPSLRRRARQASVSERSHRGRRALPLAVPGRAPPPCGFGLRSWISPASITSAVSVPGRAGGGTWRRQGRAGRGGRPEAQAAGPEAFPGRKQREEPRRRRQQQELRFRGPSVSPPCPWGEACGAAAVVTPPAPSARRDEHDRQVDQGLHPAPHRYQAVFHPLRQSSEWRRRHVVRAVPGECRDVQ